MQLAATPRPHPPPVPPRPSRQVVAEALKRSPRPPCPTRQAPPPPDTKPWRGNKSLSEKENCIRGGRTVVYDSGGKTTNGEGAAEESAKKFVEEKITDTVRVEENVNKQQQQQLNVATRTLVSERNDRNATNFSCSGTSPPPTSSFSSSSSSSPAIKPTPPTPAERHHQQIISHSNLRLHQIRQAKSPSEPSPPDRKIILSESCLQAAKLVKHQRNIQVVNGAVVFEAENRFVKSPVENNEAETTNASSIINDFEFRCSKDSSSSVVLSPINKTHEEKEDSILKLNVENDEQEERINKDYNSSSSSNISSDDCATVVQVVVDEQERKVAFEDSVNIQHEDWLEAGVRYSSTKITLSGDETHEETFVNGFHSHDDDELISTFDFASIKEKIAMSSLQGLPPLPRSLSGFNLNSTPTRDSNEPPPPPARSSSRPQRGSRPTQPTGRPPPPPQGRQLTTLDTQLAKLRREMFGLRQLDLSLLSQLWSLNESIQEFRQLLQEQDDRAPSPSPSSEEGDDTSYGSHPPPHPRRPPPVSHHHRTPRPPPRNDSPSSEEYGAV